MLTEIKGFGFCNWIQLRISSFLALILSDLMKQRGLLLPSDSLSVTYFTVHIQI